ncbi:MAG: hypothetical protein ABUK01_15780 [Leptospirales bacterium]
MKNSLRVFLFIFISISVFSKESLDSFEMEAGKEKYYIYYNSTMTEIRNKTFEKDRTSYTDAIITRLSVSRKDKTDYLVRFGYSKKAGPVFYLLEAQKKGYKVVLKYSGRYMTIPGDGSVRAYGSKNYSVPEIRIFRRTEKGLVEIAQEIIYVGFKSIAAKSVSLYASSNLKSKIQTLDSREELTVVVRKKTAFYIVTKTGKAGWLHIGENTTKRDSPVKELYGLNESK